MKAALLYYLVFGLGTFALIAPRRKNDPGPAFPMKDFRKSLGF